MKIVVLMKQVPDTYAERSLNPEDNTLNRDSVDAVINEIDEYAIEEGLLLKEAHGGEVTVLTMGPERAGESVRKALSMGVDRGVRITDEALRGSCAITTAKVLAAALATMDYDVVIAGSEATDSRLSVVPALVAEALGKPALTGARKVEIDGSSIRVERATESGFDRFQANLPAVVSVVEKINVPRYPSFKGIMAAKSKPVTELAVADLGLEPSAVGKVAATSVVDSFVLAPPRSAGQVVTDSGEGGAAIAAYLEAKKLI